MPRPSLLPPIAAGLSLLLLLMLILVATGGRPLLGGIALVAGASLAGFILYLGRKAEVGLAGEGTACEKEVIEAMNDAVLRFDAEGRIGYLNPAARQLLAATVPPGQPLPGETLRLINRHSRKDIATGILTDMAQGLLISLPPQTILISAEGMEVEVEGRCNPILGADGQRHGAVMVLRDVTEMREMLRQQCRLEQQDPLTSLPKRQVVEEALGKALLGNRAAEQPMHYLYLGVEGVDPVYAREGHAAGDELLRQLARLLHSRLRDTDLLARIDDRAFGILLKACPADAAERIATTLKESLDAYAFDWGGETFRVPARVGLVHIEPNAATLDEYMDEAQAKAA